MFATKTIITACKADQVWNLLTNISEWPRWNPDIQKVTMTLPFSLSARGAIFFRQGWRTKFTITQYVPGSSYTISFKNLLADVHIHRFIGYHNHKTTITNEIWAEGVLSQIWWSLFSSAHLRMLDEELMLLGEMMRDPKIKNAYSA
ncbi:MAG: SRPBCC family protein [Chitinophagaceae bacterium]